MSAAPAAVYSTRPLFVDAELFRWLCHANHLGALLFGCALTVLLCVYPTVIFRRANALAPTVILAWIPETLQLLPKAWVSVYNVILVYVLLIVVAGVQQWRATREAPVERASLGWMLLSVLLGISVFVVAVMLPILVGERPLASQALGLVGFMLMYVGICLGVLKLRLFELERWWFRTWTWILGGALLLATDVALVRLFRMDDERALWLALATAGFLYFPARQWLFMRITRRSEDTPTFDAKDLIGALDHGQLRRRFASALQAIFRPLEVRASEAKRDHSEMGPLGRDLMVPSPLDDGSFVCRFRDDGRRLYRPEDATRANELCELARAVRRALDARHEGELKERQRIRRDLHDDLGASLVHIVQQATSAEEATLGKKAMRDLREIISALSSEPMKLSMVLEELETEVRERCGSHLELHWQVRGETDAELTARERSNVTRAIREAATNAIKHGSNRRIRFSFQLGGARLRASVENDIELGGESQSGLGLGNIHARMQEIGGSALSSSTDGTFVLKLELPLGGSHETPALP